MMETEVVAYGGSQQMILSVILGVMIFGLALDIRTRDFLRVGQRPRGPIAGVIAQFLLLPAATLIVTLFTQLDPAVELGMILVSCCPGGAISNFITLLARGNVALSLSMTALSSLLAIVLLPLNFAFWSSLNPETAALLQRVQVDASGIFEMLLWVLALPLAAGQLVRHRLPALAEIAHRLIKPVSVVILFSFILIAVGQNIDQFLTNFWTFFVVVASHNALAFALGFLAATIGRLNRADKLAVSIEVGIQNSALAIAIIYSHFVGDSNMLLIAAFWGTWHIVAGLLVAGGSQLLFRPAENTISASVPQKG